VLLGIAALGWSGCLLFTDPVNQAPVVTLSPELDKVPRGQATDFTAKVVDEDGLAITTVRWAEFGVMQDGCAWISSASWTDRPVAGPTEVARDAPFHFTPKNTSVTCLCAQASDGYGAAGQACRRLVVTTPPPRIVVTDLDGKPVNGMLPKCSQVQLSAAQSTGQPSDDLKFSWSLDYTGTDPNGKLVKLTDCPGRTPPTPGAYQCFYSAAPGEYVVTLVVTDVPPAGGGDTATASVALAFSIADDTPAWIQTAAPDIDAGWIVLARNAALGGQYQSRTFTVATVADDCEPFPPRRDAPTQPPPTFIWSVMDGTQGKTTWEVRATGQQNSFVIDQDNFRGARPGDTIGLRVEVRDTLAQQVYATQGLACPQSMDLCCGGSDPCPATNAQVRWTTWTVQFEP
jgi:hypothetical protein